MQSAFSSHPVAAHAAGECIGALLESGVDSPDVAILLVTNESAAHLGEMAHLLRATISPRTILGAGFPGVLAGNERAVHGPGVAMLAWSPAGRAPVWPHPAEPPRARVDSFHLSGLDELRALWDTDASWADSTTLVMADPFSVPSAGWRGATSAPGAPKRLLGGYASGATRPGTTSLLCDDAVHRDGLVALRTPAPMDLVGSDRSVVVGLPRTVTAAEGGELLELDGVAALGVCEAVLADLGVLVDAPSALRAGMLGVTVIASDRPGPTAPSTADPGSWTEGSTRAWPELGTGALRCSRALRRGDQVALTLSDTEAAAADLGRRFGAVGWPQPADALVVFADLEGAELVDDAAAVTANSPQAPAVGAITEGVLVPAEGGYGICSGVLTVGVLRGGHDPEPVRFSGG